MNFLRALPAKIIIIIMIILRSALTYVNKTPVTYMADKSLAPRPSPKNCNLNTHCVGRFLQDQKNERYRLQIVVRELQWALSKGQETADYQTAIVAFINCLIISTPQLRDRIRIRNEFIGKSIIFEHVDDTILLCPSIH